MFKKALNKTLLILATRQDLFFIVFVVIFAMMFIIPVPPVVIDMLIATNMSLTLLLLVSSTYLKGALDLSTFPAIILFTTIFRLAVSIASTRLILSTGHAGEIITTFGRFVVAGNLVIGLVVFLIVAIVMFIVIVKGAERIAEVSARFTLDAMPGKQMSIDSDLRNGDITKEDARKKRSNLEKESQFFGAMDGAMRFVKGDAIAGFVIIVVNLLGGLMVGMFSKGLGFNVAINHYGLLTVGDGLVAQIPAMFVAISAGIIVTRVGTDESTNVGGDILRELSADSRALGIAGGVVGLLGLLPGFPTIIFLTLSAFLCGMAWLLHSQRSKARDESSRTGVITPTRKEAESGPIYAPLRPAMPGDPFVVVATPERIEEWRAAGLGAQWLERLGQLRLEMGFDLPDLGFRANPKMAEDAYYLEVDDVPVHRGIWRHDQFLLERMTTAAEQAGARGEMMEDPLFGARMILTPQDAERLAAAGVDVTDPIQRLVHEFRQLYIRYSPRVFGVSEASGWLMAQKPRHEKLVTEVESAIPILRMVDLLRRLLDEEVFLSQPRALLEIMLQENEDNKDIIQFTEAVRRGMSRQIVWRHLGDNNSLNIVLLEPTVEAFIMDLVNAAPADIANPRPGEQLSGRTFAQRVAAIFATLMKDTPKIVLVTSPRVRPLVRNLLVRHGVFVPVISYQEIGPDVQVKPVRALNPVDVGIPQGAMPGSMRPQGMPPGGMMPPGGPRRPGPPPGVGGPQPGQMRVQ